jgi:hypothetical protein
LKPSLGPEPAIPAQPAASGPKSAPKAAPSESCSTLRRAGSDTLWMSALEERLLSSIESKSFAICASWKLGSPAHAP